MILAVLLVGSVRTIRAEGCPEHLFTVERSKNANIVVYDAHRTSSGELDPKRPVTVYWRLNAEKGQRADLNRIERQRAYGFDAHAVEDHPGSYRMVFNAGKKRTFLVRIRDGCAEAIATIHGHPAVVTRIFVKSKEEGMMPTVESVEIFGRDVATGASVEEKFTP
jgi:hypothetical protein